MDRRSFTKFAASGAVLGLAGGTALWLGAPRDHAHLGLDRMLDHLSTLAPGSLRMQGQWDAFRTFNHLAQSIEFSMDGFPEAKSPLFQNTVGSLAFKVFRARGAMSHGLDEEIPGEIVAAEAGDTRQALDRLMGALTTFRAYDGDLKPHFAYGALGKDDYALAHTMHITNHLEEVQTA